MSDHPNGNRADQDLEARFEHLRAEYRASTPDFDAMVAAAHDPQANVVPISSHRRWRRWSAFGGGLVAAAAAALLIIGPDTTSDQDFADLVNSYAANTAWTAPTDGLLELPGSEVLRTMPSIAMPRVIGPMSASDTL